MAANAPETQILVDSENTVEQKVALYFNAATTSNTKILAANTVNGANASRICVLDIERVRYHVSLASGYVSVEFQGSANSKAVNLGGNDGGVIDLYIPNNATAKTGDINLAVVGAQANDCATLLITYRKNNANGAFDNLYSTAAGANGFPSAY